MLTDAITSISAGTSAATGTELPCDGFYRVGWSLQTSNDTVSAGSVVIEWANTSGYGGTWKNLATMTPVQYTQDGGSSDVAGGFVRARIATGVTGGATVTVVLKRLAHVY